MTGTTSGIDEATANRLVDAGFGVVGNGRSADELEALEKGTGVAYRGVAGGAAEDGTAERLFASDGERSGRRPDIWVRLSGTNGRDFPGRGRGRVHVHTETP